MFGDQSYTFPNYRRYLSGPSRLLAMDKEAIHEKAEHFFERIWEQEDAWALDSSSFEQARYAALMAKLEGRRLGKVLEIGCGAGAFTVRLVPLADRIIALDI